MLNVCVHALLTSTPSSKYTDRIVCCTGVQIVDYPCREASVRGQHQLGRNCQWSNTLSLLRAHSSLPHHWFLFHFSICYGHSGFYNNPLQLRITCTKSKNFKALACTLVTRDIYFKGTGTPLDANVMYTATCTYPIVHTGRVSCSLVPRPHL